MVTGLAAPSGAPAHAGNPNFESALRGLSRPVDGLSAQIIGYDDRIQVVNRSGQEVTIMGYEGEPYARLLPDGTVETNANSPATYLNEDRFAAVEVPARADPGAPPEWREVSGDGTFTWHDHRIHWMAKSTPPQVTDEDERSKVFDYRVPVEVGGEPDAIAGTLYWVGPADTSKTPFLIAGLAIVVLGGTGVLVLRRRRGHDGGEGDRPAREGW
jgi:hypothetical protein